MKKKMFTRPVSVVLACEMYQQISKITEQREVSVSDYIREALQALRVFRCCLGVPASRPPQGAPWIDIPVF
jgi:hypothetical protein